MTTQHALDKQSRRRIEHEVDGLMVGAASLKAETYDDCVRELDEALPAIVNSLAIRPDEPVVLDRSFKGAYRASPGTVQIHDYHPRPPKGCSYADYVDYAGSLLGFAHSAMAWINFTDFTTWDRLRPELDVALRPVRTCIEEARVFRSQGRENSDSKKYIYAVNLLAVLRGHLRAGIHEEGPYEILKRHLRIRALAAYCEMPSLFAIEEQSRVALEGWFTAGAAARFHAVLAAIPQLRSSEESHELTVKVKAYIQDEFNRANADARLGLIWKGYMRGVKAKHEPTRSAPLRLVAVND